MSLERIARSPDLVRLRNEGYDLEIKEGCLLVHDVPYVTTGRVITRGTWVTKLEVQGDVTRPPTDHVAYWCGDRPCHSDGRPIHAIWNSSNKVTLVPGVDADHTFSAKAAYRDYHHKVTAYLAPIEGEARKLDPTATSQSYPPVRTDVDESVFEYLDSATLRNGTGALNERITTQRVAIVGLGGTGSYVLDLLAKTPVRGIVVIDADEFSQHNAFRAPGAASLDDLQKKQGKVEYLAATYARMRRGIVSYRERLTPGNARALLDGVSFVFLCLDESADRRALGAVLESMRLSFIDVGIGVHRTDEGLQATLRVTTSTPEDRSAARKHASSGPAPAGDDEYSTNVQLAELNMMNAALAVLRWKQLNGFYRDAARTNHILYSTASNDVAREGTE